MSMLSESKREKKNRFQLVFQFNPNVLCCNEREWLIKSTYFVKVFIGNEMKLTPNRMK